MKAHALGPAAREGAEPQAGPLQAGSPEIPPWHEVSLAVCVPPHSVADGVGGGVCSAAADAALVQRRWHERRAAQIQHPWQEPFAIPGGVVRREDEVLGVYGIRQVPTAVV